MPERYGVADDEVEMERLRLSMLAEIAKLIASTNIGGRMLTADEVA